LCLCVYVSVCVCMCVRMHARVYGSSVAGKYFVSVKHQREMERDSPTHVFQ